MLSLTFTRRMFLQGLAGAFPSFGRCSCYNSLHAPVAQWIERRFPKPCVGGSSPLGGAIIAPRRFVARRCFIALHRGPASSPRSTSPTSQHSTIQPTAQRVTSHHVAFHHAMLHRTSHHHSARHHSAFHLTARHHYALHLTARHHYALRRAMTSTSNPSHRTPPIIQHITIHPTATFCPEMYLLPQAQTKMRHKTC